MWSLNWSSSEIKVLIGPTRNATTHVWGEACRVKTCKLADLCFLQKEPVRASFLMFQCCFLCVFTDSKGLSNPSEVEALREKVYASLEAYCKHKYPEQPGRYGCKHIARPRPGRVYLQKQHVSCHLNTHTHTHTHISVELEE